MKRTSQQQSTEQQNSPSCHVWEYGHIMTIDGADAHINGRYPETRFAVNKISDMTLRVLGGYGVLVTKTARQELNPGDVAFIPHEEAYYFNGTQLHIFMACAPAWSPDQYTEID